MLLALGWEIPGNLGTELARTVFGEGGPQQGSCQDRVPGNFQES